MNRQRKISPATRKALKVLGFGPGTGLYPWHSLEHGCITVATEAFEDDSVFLIRLDEGCRPSDVCKFKALLKEGEAGDIRVRGRGHWRNGGHIQEPGGDAYVNQRRLVSLARKMKKVIDSRR